MYILPYLLLKKRLESIPELKIIDLDLGQGTNGYNGGITDQPAVFIAMQEVAFNSLGNGQQMGVLQIDIKIITDVSHKDDRLLTEGKPINHFALAELIFKKLHKFRGVIGQLDNYESYGEVDEVVFASLQRTNTGYQIPAKNLFTSTITFSGTVKEVSFEPILTRLPNAIVPINLIRPIITADYENNILTVSNGVWFSISQITYTYQWYKNNAIIAGETNQAIAFTETDEGATYYCQVTATNSTGPITVNSLGLTVKIPPQVDQSTIYASGIYENGIYQ